MAEQTESSKYFAEQLASRKRWRWIWWVVAAIVVLFGVASLTNPTSELDHYRALHESLTDDVIPTMVDYYVMEKQRADSRSSSTLSLAGELMKSDLGTHLLVSEVDRKITVDNVEDYIFFSLGYHGSEVVTIGLMGHVWTVFDFLSDNGVVSKFNDLKGE